MTINNKKKMYLSGPMRGYAEFNFPAFERVTNIIRAERSDIELITPHELENACDFDPDKFDPYTDSNVKDHLKKVLKRDAEFVLESDCVLTMHGWEDSKGASAEVMLAQAAGIPCFEWEEIVHDVPHRVALCGPKGVGKSTFARRVTRDHSLLSFATPLRVMLSKLPFPVEYLYEMKNLEIPLLGKTGRHCLQSLGSEWGRKLIHEDIWVKCMEQEILDAGDHTPIIIDDLRFDNEAKMLKEQGFKIWRVVRDFEDKFGDAHMSEKGVSSSLIDKEVGV